MSTLEKILEDLYAYDSDFRSHEKELSTIITKLLSEKPNTLFDEQFAESLRRKIIIQAQHIKDKQTNTSYTLRNIQFVFSGVLLIVITFLGTQYIKVQNKSSENIANTRLFSGTVSIKNIAPQGFGTLQITANSQEPTQTRPTNTQEQFTKINPTKIQTTQSLIYPPQPRTTYVYKGKDFTMDTPEATVYKKIVTPIHSETLTKALSAMNFGLFSIQSFSHITLQNISFAEDRDFGYSFYINMEDGSMNIFENWSKWQTPDRLCTDESCTNAHRIQFSNVPKDNEIISIAEQFLKDHGIDRDSYGETRVENSWKEEYEKAPDKNQVWIPDTINVIFPYLIDKQTLFDQSGQTNGLSVSVNIRVKKVSSVSNLSHLTFESSQYPTEKDVKKLITQAEQGGFQNTPINFDEPDLSDNTTSIGLDSPHIELVSYYSYSQNKTDQLLVPSLVFPTITTDQTQDIPYPKFITVPIVSGLVTSNSQIMR